MVYKLLGLKKNMLNNIDFFKINSLKKKFLIGYFLTFLSIIFSKLIWNKLQIPFDNSIEIEGVYFDLKYHQLNDFLRFLVFISIPLTINLIIFLKFKIFQFKNLSFFFLCDLKKNLIYLNKNFLLTIFFLVVIDLICLELNFSKIDIFHEGQQLTGAFNSIENEGLYRNSNIYVGLFFEVLSGLLTKEIFGNINISSLRLFNSLMHTITIIVGVFLVWKISNYQNLTKEKKIFFFFFLSLVLFYLFKSVYFSSRDLPTFLFLIFLILFLFEKKKKYLFFLTIVCLASFFYSVDRAIFINFTLFFFLIYLFFQKKFKEIILTIIFTLINWVLFYLILGNLEFNLFVQNTIDIYKYSGWIQGIPYPEPFSSEKVSPRATKSLIFIIILGVILIKIFFTKNNISNNLKSFYFFFYILSLSNFSTALSRSDSPHIKCGESFIIFFLSIFLLLLVLKNNLRIFKKFKLLNIKKFNYLKILLFIFLFFLISKANLKNIFDFPRFKNYVLIKDDYFLDEKYKHLINQLNPIILEEDCIQVFTHDAALPYLLKKKTCNKYYMTFMIGTINNQKKFIELLDEKKNLFIVTEGDHFLKNYYTPEKNFKIINTYIEENFIKKEKILTWVLNVRK